MPIRYGSICCSMEDAVVTSICFKCRYLRLSLIPDSRRSPGMTVWAAELKT